MLQATTSILIFKAKFKTVVSCRPAFKRSLIKSVFPKAVEDQSKSVYVNAVFF